MNFYKLLFVIVLGLLVIIISNNAIAQHSSFRKDTIEWDGKEVEVAEREIFIALKSTVAPTSMTDLLDLYNLNVVRQFDELNNGRDQVPISV